MSNVIQDGCHCRPYFNIGAYEKPTDLTEPKNHMSDYYWIAIYIYIKFWQLCFVNGLMTYR